MAFNRPIPYKVGDDIEVWGHGIDMVEINQRNDLNDPEDSDIIIVPREHLRALIDALLAAGGYNQR